MINKKKTYIRRLNSIRSKIKFSNLFRLVVYRTSRHIYAQIISINGFDILVSASTLEKSIYNQLSYTGNKDAAFIVGKTIALRSLNKCIYNVVFDRSGFKYHGRIQVLAEAARKFGLIF